MLPIAEKFISIQGEGQYTGTSMFFIRLAGCSVGKGTFPFTCTAWNGSKFECDTDYRKYSEDTIGGLVLEVRDSGLKHVSITGGEPLMHRDIDRLVRAFLLDNIIPHVETSGTIRLPPEWYHPLPHEPGTHLTVSPKEGYRHDVLHRADEIKVLIGIHQRNFPWSIKEEPKAEFILKEFGEWADKIWLQPINNYGTLNQVNVERCIAIIKEEPRFRLSLQMHKVIGVR